VPARTMKVKGDPPPRRKISLLASEKLIEGADFSGAGGTSSAERGYLGGGRGWA